MARYAARSKAACAAAAIAALAQPALAQPALAQAPTPPPAPQEQQPAPNPAPAPESEQAAPVAQSLLRGAIQGGVGESASQTSSQDRSDSQDDPSETSASSQPRERQTDTSADPAALAREDLSEIFGRAIAEFEFDQGLPFRSLRRSVIPADDPYAPLGVRAGAFLLFPELGIGTVSSDNIFASPRNARSDTAFELNPRLRFQSGWSRHALAGDVQATRSWYREFDSEDEDSYDAILRGRIDVRRSTNIEIEALAARFQESRGSIDFPDAAAQPGDIATHSIAAGLNHTFNRVTGTLRGALAEIDYSDAGDFDGTEVSNDDRDYRQDEAGVRLAYEFNPGMTAFADGEINKRRFRRAIDDEGFRRDSDGWEAQAGLRFDFNTKITGEMALGYALQNPQDAAFVDVEGLILNGNIFWRPTALTTLRFEARSAIEQTTTIDSAGALTRAYLIGIDHALRRNILLGGYLAFAESDYAGSDLVEVRHTGGLTFEYRLNRGVAIEAAWNHTHYDAGAVDSEYRENEFRVGMRLRR